MIRVLIAEDQKLVLAALSSLLSMEDDILVVANASDGQMAVELALQHRPDVALIDIEMPKQSGLDVVKQLTNQLPTCRCLIVTTFARAGYLQRAVRSGAYGYILKDADVSEIAAAIKTIYHGGKVMDPQLMIEAMASPSPLLQRESELLTLASQGLSTKEMASTLHLSEGTVRNYLSEIMSKLGVASRQAAIDYARQSGWI